MNPATTYTSRLKARFYRPEDDPYRVFEREIGRRLKSDHTLVDAGCGRNATVLRLFAPEVKTAIGIDLEQFSPEALASGVRLIQGDITRIDLPDGAADIVISRSVMEHLRQPELAYAEVHRVLRPGGAFLFVTPNNLSYPILISRLVPNRFHGAVVRFAEGRPDEDTFPVYYRTNSRRAIRGLAEAAGFEVEEIRYLTVFPAYLQFNPIAFLLGVGYERLVSRCGPLNGLQHWLMAVLRKSASD